MGRARPDPLLLFFPTKAVTEVDTAHTRDCQSYCSHEMDERGHWHSGHFQTNNSYSYPPWILLAPWLVKTCCASAGNDFPGPSGYGKFRVWWSTLTQSFSPHLQSLSAQPVANVTQQHREIQFWMVKSEPDEAPGSDSQKASAFDICWTWMKVPKSECSWGLKNKHPQDVCWLSDGHALKCLFTEVQVVPIPILLPFTASVQL